MRASLSMADLLKSAFSLAIRSVILSSIWPLKVASLGFGPCPFSEDIHLAVDVKHGMRREALAVAGVGAGAFGAPRLLCRALRPSWDDIVGLSQIWADVSAPWVCEAKLSACSFFLVSAAGADAMRLSRCQGRQRQLAR